jgi:hypothetical protein
MPSQGKPKIHSHLGRHDEAQEQDNLNRKKESEPSILFSWGFMGWVSWAWEGAPSTKFPKSNNAKVLQLCISEKGLMIKILMLSSRKRES